MKRARLTPGGKESEHVRQREVLEVALERQRDPPVRVRLLLHTGWFDESRTRVTLSGVDHAHARQS